MIGVIRLANEVTDNLHFIAFRTDHAAFAGDQQQALSGRRPFVDSAKQPAPPHQIIGRIDGQLCFYVLLDHHTLEVQVEKSQGLNALFQQLAQQQVEVLSLRNKSNRLEELFVSLVEKNLAKVAQ